MSLINFSDSPSFTDLKGQLQENSDPQDFVEHSDGHRLYISKIMRIIIRLERLTLPNCDFEGNSLQLWKICPAQLLGTVQNKQGKGAVISA